MNDNIKKWKGFDHFKDIMDNIYVGCKVLVSDDYDDKILKECTVTDITVCSLQEEENVDAMCQLCVGEIGLDGDRPDCFHTDSILSREIDTYIRKVVNYKIEFIEEDEMKI